MDWPRVTIQICTYNREKEIAQTIYALMQKMSYPKDRLDWLICDDSSPNDYVQRLSGVKIIEQIKPRFSVTPQNSGWAVNVNLGMKAIQTEYTFFIEDDYILRKPLDLCAGIALLEMRPNIGMLRYRGTAGDHLIYHQFEADISGYLPDYQDGVGLPSRITYLQLDSGSPALYLYSHGVHLKRKSFHAFYGKYPEGLQLGATEEKMAHQVKDLMTVPGAPAIAILPEWVSLWFDHVGQSYQHTELDKEYNNAR